MVDAVHQLLPCASEHQRVAEDNDFVRKLLVGLPCPGVEPGIANVAGEVVRFLQDVFAAQGDVCGGAPAEMRIGDSVLMVSDGGAARAPQGAVLYVYVPDADETFARAIAVGARVIEPPEDTPYADRRATIADRWGNTWQIATRRAR